MRPVDENGDILPVLHVSDMIFGSVAIAGLIEDRLNLFVGDWWENYDWGNEVLQMLQESRLTESDAQLLSNYLSSYVRETPYVQDVRDEKWTFVNNQFSWECTVLTESGEAYVSYSI